MPHSDPQNMSDSSLPHSTPLLQDALSITELGPIPWTRPPGKMFGYITNVVDLTHITDIVIYDAVTSK